MDGHASIDVTYKDQWVAFYFKQGYTRTQSEILAEQLCFGRVREYCISLDGAHVFSKPRKHFSGRRGIQESISLRDISIAIFSDQRYQFKV